MLYYNMIYHRHLAQAPPSPFPFCKVGVAAMAVFDASWSRFSHCVLACSC